MKAYYHIYLPEDNSWIYLLLDQFKAIKDSSLDDKLQILNITAIGKESNKEHFFSILKYHKNFINCEMFCDFLEKQYEDSDLKNFNKNPSNNFLTESITLHKLWKESKESSEDYPVLYFHAKGVTSQSRHLNENDVDFGYNNLVNYFYWRKFLDWSMLENHEQCLKLLSDSKVDVVGTNYSSWPTHHFSGNYWWAKSKHIKKLRDPNDLALWHKFRTEKDFPWYFTDRIKDEMWVLSEQANIISLFNHDSPPPKSSLSECLILKKEYAK